MNDERQDRAISDYAAATIAVHVALTALREHERADVSGRLEVENAYIDLLDLTDNLLNAMDELVTVTVATMAL